MTFTIFGRNTPMPLAVLVDRGAASVYATVSHGLLAGRRLKRLDASPIQKLFMTDSVETQPVELSQKIEVVSVAGLFGEAIRRIARRKAFPCSSANECRHSARRLRMNIREYLAESVWTRRRLTAFSTRPPELGEVRIR